MRVLIVEDEPALAFRLQQVLEGAGFTVDVAYDGEEGWHLGDTEPYDAVVLDLGLPRIDGVTPPRLTACACYVAIGHTPTWLSLPRENT